MPCEMHGKSGAFDPCRFGRRKECETLTGAPLHLHHMGDDVNGARMSGIEGERAPRHLFGTTILAVLLEGERVHRKDARVAGHCGVPFRQHLGDTIAHHASPAEAEVECMRDHERENVARPVDDDGAVTFERKSRVALEPSTRRGRVTACGVVDVWARRLDGGHARSKRGSRGGVIGTHDDRGAQTMAEDALGVVGKHPLNLGRGIAAMRQQQLERVLASRQQIGIGFDGCGLWRVSSIAQSPFLWSCAPVLARRITPLPAGRVPRWVPGASRQWIARPRASAPPP